MENISTKIWTLPEAIGAYSKKEFLVKITIAYKEARETKYWLRLLKDSSYITVEHSKLLLDKCDELIRIIASIQKSIKSQL